MVLRMDKYKLSHTRMHAHVVVIKMLEVHKHKMLHLSHIL